MTEAKPSPQAPNAVVMVRPHHFSVNTMTAADNSFQITPKGERDKTIEASAYHEVTKAVETLRAKGIEVHLFEDTGFDTPDSVFPNNWFSTHPNGRVVLYPMFAPNRRGERREDIVERLSELYDVNDVVDYSSLENEGSYLEGTGAVVIDHNDHTAYCAISKRSNADTFKTWCDEFGYRPVIFDAADSKGLPIYHTNVMMCIGKATALIGLKSVTSSAKRDEIAANMKNTGRELIDLTPEQVEAFAGNALELTGDKGSILVLSTTAQKALSDHQITQISRHCEIVALDVPTVELSGGSARCMLAGIHLLTKHPK